MNAYAKIVCIPVAWPTFIEIGHRKHFEKIAKGGSANGCSWMQTVLGMDGSPIPHPAWLQVCFQPSGKQGNLLCLLEEDEHLLKYATGNSGVRALFACQINATPDGPWRTLRGAEEHLASRYGVNTVDWRHSSFYDESTDSWNYTNTTATILPQLK